MSARVKIKALTCTNSRKSRWENAKSSSKLPLFTPRHSEFASISTDPTCSWQRGKWIRIQIPKIPVLILNIMPTEDVYVNCALHASGLG